MPIIVDPISPGDSWYYSERAGVATILDAATIAVTWDMDDSSAEDAGAMVQDGIKADGYINLALANAGVTVPVVLSGAGAASDYIVSTLADASNHLTIWNGWKRRGLQELTEKLPGKDIPGLMSGYKAYADELLSKIVNVSLAAANGGGAIQAFIPSRETCAVWPLGYVG